MEHVTALVGGSLLASVALLHRVIAGRSLSVSGRYTALTDRALNGPAEEEPELTDAEMTAALNAIALQHFGADALREMQSAAPADDPEPPALERPMPPSPLMHALFLVSVVAGGALSVALSGDWSAAFDLNGESFHGRYGAGMSSAATLALVLGGVCVGFGTRMAGGCTSGHGLCGVSRFQSGALLATAVFFGVGILTTVLIGWGLS